MEKSDIDLLISAVCSSLAKKMANYNSWPSNLRNCTYHANLGLINMRIFKVNPLIKRPLFYSNNT